MNLLETLNGVAEPLMWASSLIGEYGIYILPLEDCTAVLNTAYQMACDEDNRWYQAKLLLPMVKIHLQQGQINEAKQVIQQIMTICETLEYNVALIFEANMYMGAILKQEQHYDEAIAYHEKSIALAEEAQYLYGLSSVRTSISLLHIQCGRIPEAKEHVACILDWHRCIGQDWQTLGALYGGVAKHLFVQLGQLERAAEILEFVVTHPLVVRHTQEQAEGVLQTIKEQLDEETFKKACERGRTFELHRLVDDLIVELGQAH